MHRPRCETIQDISYLRKMADVHSKAIRSKNMAAIKSKNTRPEMLVRRFLHAHGFRYKLHDKNLPGKADIVLPKYKTVIFIHGCFWHQHQSCRYAKFPQSNTSYWMPKLLNNIQRDEGAEAVLKAAGWRVIVIWECMLKKAALDKTLASLLKKINSRPSFVDNKTTLRISFL